MPASLGEPHDAVQQAFTTARPRSAGCRPRLPLRLDPIATRCIEELMASLCADGRECNSVSRSLNPDHKHSLVALFRIPKIKRYFAKFLKEQSDQNYLIATSARPVAGSA
jgi:hypothetical protein